MNKLIPAPDLPDEDHFSTPVTQFMCRVGELRSIYETNKYEIKMEERKLIFIMAIFVAYFFATPLISESSYPFGKQIGDFLCLAMMLHTVLMAIQIITWTFRSKRFWDKFGKINDTIQYLHGERVTTYDLDDNRWEKRFGLINE